MEITILHNQSLFDVAIQHTGNVTNAFAIAAANGLSVTALLASGAVINLPDAVEMNNDLYGFYTAKKIQPATAWTGETDNGEQELEGIGYWIINKNFKVS
ncbi:hypothetical protein ACK2M7_12595 [Chryseobacterium sp. TY4]